MSQRLRCPSCRAVFVIPDDHVAGRAFVCPKCGARGSAKAAAAPTSTPAPAREPKRLIPTPEEQESVFVPSPDAPSRKRRRWLIVASLTLVTALGVGLVVAWPALRAWWKPKPVDPVEGVATAYLQALIKGDQVAAARLGAVELPPAIRTFRNLHKDRGRAARVRGSFAPVAALHSRIDADYVYDPSSGRYTPKNALGPAAETLDALHAAKDKAEKEGLYKKIESGDPDDLFDAAEGLAKTFSTLAEGALAPKRLVPTYRKLVEESKPPLPAAEKTLAFDYDDHRQAWDTLLKRPFTTLKADGPFILEHAEVTADVIDRLGSLGDPPTPLRLTLMRFRLEGIDTGWKVTSARRQGEEIAAEEPPPEAPKPKGGSSEVPEKLPRSYPTSPAQP